MFVHVVTTTPTLAYVSGKYVMSSTVTEAIENYDKEKRVALSDDLTETVSWWKERGDKHPVLAKIAKTFLACPPGSVASEQLFSGAGIIYDEKRNALKGETSEKLLFLKNNMPLLKFEY